MPKPIYMNEEMIDECFADVRTSFEQQFAAALERARTGKTPLARGVFSFQPVTYEWTNDKTKAKVVLEPTAFSKICLLMYNTDKEIGWHGLITRDEADPNLFHVEDVILYPQTVTSITVQTDDAKYSNWVVELPNEQFDKLRFHGHSHVNMGVTPSGTDLTYYSSLIRQFKDGFYVFMIINKKMEIFCQVYDFDNNSMYETDEVEVVIGQGFGEQLSNSKKEMVTTQTYSYSGYNGYYGQDRYNGYYDDDTVIPSRSRDWGARNGSWKKDEPKTVDVEPKNDSKKDDAGGAKETGSKVLDGQKALNLPPYVADDEEPWWQEGSAS